MQIERGGHETMGAFNGPMPYPVKKWQDDYASEFKRRRVRPTTIFYSDRPNPLEKINGERRRERENGTLELNMLIEKGRETKGDLDIRHRPQGTAFIIFHVNFNKDYENKLIIKSYHDATSYVIMKTT